MVEVMSGGRRVGGPWCWPGTAVYTIVYCCTIKLEDSQPEYTPGLPPLQGSYLKTESNDDKSVRRQQSSAGQGKGPRLERELLERYNSET